MNFHPIERDNLAECEAVFIDVFNNPPWNESWEAEAVTQRLENCYRTPGFRGLAVKIDGEVTGFAVGCIEQWDKSKYFCLKEICVLPTRQRRGIGAALISALEENLRNEGVEKLYLHTARGTFAQSFYDKQGFQVSAKMIMMSKWLNSQ